MIDGVVHKRSGVRHLLAADDLATLCGRWLRRTSFRQEQFGEADCRSCLTVLHRARRAEAREIGSGRR